MNKLLSIKIASIVFVALLIVIPLQLIKEKITERAYLRDTASAAVASSWTGEQTVSGPVIVLSYQERVMKKQPENNGFRYKLGEELKTRQRFFTPDSLTIDAAMRTEILHKGIFPVPVYTTELGFAGTFDFSVVQRAINTLMQSESIVKVEAAELVWRISDARGINAVSPLVLNGSSYPLEPGALSAWTGSGMHLELTNEMLIDKDQVPFQLDIKLRGMRKLSFAPLARQTDITLKSDWPHPSFQGAFLPAQREITQEGFTASWHVNEFASNAAEQLQHCAQSECGDFHTQSLGVALVDPIDIYLQSERAVKYGFLFVALIFTAFFMFELLAHLKIHPVQYSLVGAAIATFFLLLISLAEHTGFPRAYAVSAAASLGIIANYLRSVLQSWSAAGAFSVCLGALYWLLYMIIKSEDYALLMGSMLCFMVLAAVMILTRKINWYGFGQDPNELADSTSLDKKPR